MKQEILDLVEQLEKHPLTEKEVSFMASIKTSKYDSLTEKMQAWFDRICDQYLKGIVPQAKGPNPAFQDPLFLIELAIKKCKPEHGDLSDKLTSVLRAKKQELLEASQKASKPLEDIDIPF